MSKNVPLLSASFGLLAASVFPAVFAGELPDPRIAKWYGNRAAAVSLRFDDSLDSHVTYVIPKLNEYGIKATFMVNPGLERYQKNKEVWETQVPRMGHQLGNHTMHHHGARTPEEADFEIGEVSRLIWSLDPLRSKLLVFASGGGRADSWGGKAWKEASPEYKVLVNKYYLIDLYDGRHAHLGPDSKHAGDDIVRSVRKAVQEHGHQAIAFHDVGALSVIDYLKTIYRGRDLTLSREAFEKGMAFLHKMQDVVWVAPLGDILKYETERNSALLNVLSRSAKDLRLSLTVGTDRELYDHPLTLIVPNTKKQEVKSIVQENRGIESYTNGEHGILFDVKPVSGTVRIIFQ